MDFFVINVTLRFYGCCLLGRVVLLALELGDLALHRLLVLLQLHRLVPHEVELDLPEQRPLDNAPFRGVLPLFNFLLKLLDLTALFIHFGLQLHVFRMLKCETVAIERAK